MVPCEIYTDAQKTIASIDVFNIINDRGDAWPGHMCTDSGVEDPYTTEWKCSPYTLSLEKTFGHP